MGFRVPSIEQAVERVEKLGIRILTAPQKSVWGWRAVVVDPDGHRVEVVEPTARARETHSSPSLE
ncbi:MAG: VOC family protein [Planctomycetaceae bacterium]